MQATLIENNENGRIAYDSLIVSEPKALSVLNSKIAMKIVRSLADSPCCAIDVARKLKIHEQKIYYHLRNLERSGIVYTISQERRHGMIAKIYSVVSPVVAAKLFEKGVEIKENFSVNVSSDFKEFLSPFLSDNGLDTKIIIGDPGPHGRFEEYGRDGIHIIDFALFLGTFATTLNFPFYKTDVETHDNDLKNNLILIGTPKTNTIIDKIRNRLPFNFNIDKWQLNTPSAIYSDSQIGIISIFPNPFEKNKKIMLFSGLSSRGVKSAIVAITKYSEETIRNWKGHENFVRIMRGLDKDSDGVIDDIKFLE